MTSNDACASPTTATGNSISMTVNSNIIPSVSISATQTQICSGTAVVFTAVPVNGGSTPSYQWLVNGSSVGSNSPYFAISNLQNADVVGCIMNSSALCSNPNQVLSNTLTITVNPNTFGTAFGASQTNFTQSPYIVQFSNNTPNASQYSFVWNFGDGTASTDVNPLHQYINAGSYAVSLSATDINTGCSETVFINDYITCQGSGNQCSFSINLNQTGSIAACQGGMVPLSVTTSAINPIYQWIRNGVYIGGATQPQYLATQDGIYSVVVFENATCPLISSAVSLSFSNPSPPQPLITASGNLVPCSGDAVTLFANNVAGATSLLWSNGSGANSISVNQSGYYTVTASYGIGCQSGSLPITLNGSLAANPGICLVTVDSLTNKNLIVWETPVAADIDSFYIYKLDPQNMVYEKIGAVDYLNLSEFIDQGSNANQQGDSYRLAVLDTCGSLTLPSNVHQTIHLTILPGQGNIRHLSWTNYIGTAYTFYEIYRREQGQGYQLIATLPSSQQFYTDMNAPSVVVDYKVEIVLAQSCNSVDRAAYGKSRSNVGNNQALLVVGTTDHKDLLTIDIMPNPSNGQFKVIINKEWPGANYWLEDLSGRTLSSPQPVMGTVIDFNESLPAGVYLLRWSHAGKTISKRLIITRS
jgi:PKD repeat protein